MKKAKIIIAILLTLPLLSFSQVDCSGFIGTLKPEDPFKINSMSKSAACVSGHIYELVIPVQKGWEYRIVFYASPAYNNDIKFKIVDLNTNKTIVDVPGKLGEGAYPQKNGETALQSYYDEKLGKEVHPYFSLLPSSSTNLKVIIDVQEKPDLIKGCITVVVLDKESPEGQF